LQYIRADTTRPKAEIAFVAPTHHLSPSSFSLDHFHLQLKSTKTVFRSA